MKMKTLNRTGMLLSISLGLFLFSTFLFADSIVLPEGDPLQLLLDLILNFKAMSPLALGAGVIVFVVQVMKKFFPSGNFTRAVVTVLSVVWAVFQALISGLGLVQALSMVLLTMGGAVMIYEFAIAPFLPKNK